MRILYLHQYFTTPEYQGGVRSYQFARRLVAAGHEVDLVTSSAFYPVAKPSAGLISRHQVDGITVHVIHVGYGNKMSFLRRVISFLLFMLVSSLYVARLKGNDIVFATSTPLTIGVPALVARSVHKVPMVFEVRDLWPDVPIAMGYIKNQFAIKLLLRFEKYLYDKAARLVALSVGMRDEIVRKGIPAEKIEVIPNACDIEDFNQVAAGRPEVDGFRQDADTKICLYAGTFGYVNNLSYLVELAKHIKDGDYNIRILLIGDGVEKSVIAEKIANLQLENHIRLIEPVSKQELISYIKSVDACFSSVKNIPALFNNSANKFFDSLAAGKPIIINHGGWQADVIRQYSLGLVLECDAREGAELLARFFADEESFPSVEKIRDFAQENYSRDLLFDKLLHGVLEPAQRV